MNDRLKQVFQREAELEIRRKVEALFEANRVSPNPNPKIPIIDGLRDYDYDPRARDPELEDLVVRAECARLWFEGEAAPWAQPLPLREQDILACFNLGPGDHRRDIARGEYGRYLRGLDWHIEHARPFEVQCADRLAG